MLTETYHAESDPVLMLVLKGSVKLMSELVLVDVLIQLRHSGNNDILEKRRRRRRRRSWRKRKRREGD